MQIDLHSGSVVVHPILQETLVIQSLQYKLVFFSSFNSTKPKQYT